MPGTWYTISIDDRAATAFRRKAPHYINSDMARKPWLRETDRSQRSARAKSVLPVNGRVERNPYLQPVEVKANTNIRFASRSSLFTAPCCTWLGAGRCSSVLIAVKPNTIKHFALEEVYSSVLYIHGSVLANPVCQRSQVARHE